MKTIGLIGGMSWESTAIYYRLINEGVKMQLGGLHSAKMLLYSFDFAEIAVLQSEGKWDEAAALLSNAALKLESAGADVLLICTNTMHKIYPQVAEAVEIPVIHIADPTATAIKRLGLRKVGLLGTRFTMEQDFYVKRLEDEYHIEVLVPDADDRNTVHEIIYEELCQGIVGQPSRKKYSDIIQKLIDGGAEAIILGCTDIGLLVSQEDVHVPVFDTTYLHAQAAVQFSLDINLG